MMETKYDAGEKKPIYAVWHMDGSEFWAGRYRHTVWAEWLTELDAYRWAAKKMSDELDAAHARIHDLEIECKRFEQAAMSQIPGAEPRPPRY